jgi:hypothetical protein
MAAATRFRSVVKAVTGWNPSRIDDTDSDEIVGQNVRGNELPGGRTGARNRLSLRIDEIEEQKRRRSR